MTKLKVYSATVHADPAWGLFGSHGPARQAEACVATRTNDEGCRLLGLPPGQVNSWVRVNLFFTEEDERLEGIVRVRPIDRWKDPYVVAVPQPTRYETIPRYKPEPFSEETLNLRKAQKFVWGEVARFLAVGISIYSAEFDLETLDKALESVYARCMEMSK